MEAVRRVTAEFKKAKCDGGQCTEIKTPAGDPLPYFTTGLANETANAAGDFVRFWSVADIKKVIFKGKDDEPRNLPFKRLTAKGINKATKAEEYTFLGLATISFIGLAGNGGKYYRGVAGGVNQIEEWAKKAGCDTPTWNKGKKDWTSPPTPWTEAKFDKCLKQFEEDLRSDVVWEVATQVMQTLNFYNYKMSYGTASIQPKALLKDQPNPKGSGAGLGEFAAVKSAGEEATKALNTIDHDNKYGIGKGGASIEHAMKKEDATTGVDAVKAVAKAACTKLGHGFGFKYENTCAKAMWVYKYLSLGLSAPEERQYWSTDFGNAQLLTGASKSDKPVEVAKAALANVWYTLKVMRNHLVNMGIDLKASMKVVHDVDFGDADVAKGAAFSFKGKTHLRKGEKQQGSLQAEANTEAQMHALGMHILDSIATNTVNYMAGAAYAV